LAEHVNDYGKAADELEAKYESARLAKDYFALLKEVAPILRSATNMYSALQSAREALPDVSALISVRGWVMRGVPPEIVNPRASDFRRL